MTDENQINLEKFMKSSAVTECGVAFSKLNMNQKRLENAIRAFAKGVKQNSVLALIDISAFSIPAFGNGSQGIVFTETSMYAYEKGGSPFSFEYQEIAKAIYHDTGSDDHGYLGTLEIALNHGEKKYIKSKSCDKERLAIIINRIASIFGIDGSGVNQSQEQNEIDEAILDDNWKYISRDARYHYSQDINQMTTAVNSLQLKYADKENITLVTDMIFKENMPKDCHKIYAKKIEEHTGMKVNVIIEYLS